MSAGHCWFLWQIWVKLSIGLSLGWLEANWTFCCWILWSRRRIFLESLQKFGYRLYMCRFCYGFVRWHRWDYHSLDRFWWGQDYLLGGHQCWLAALFGRRRNEVCSLSCKPGEEAVRTRLRHSWCHSFLMKSPTSVWPFLRPIAFEFWSQRFTAVIVPGSLKEGLCTPAMYGYW